MASFVDLMSMDTDTAGRTATAQAPDQPKRRACDECRELDPWALPLRVSLPMIFGLV
jgi:hypothetical protein